MSFSYPLSYENAVCCNYVAYYRIKRGLKQSQLAHVCGVSRNTIISIERRKSVPHIDLCLKISSALRVPLDDLFYLYYPCCNEID